MLSRNRRSIFIYILGGVILAILLLLTVRSTFNDKKFLNRTLSAQNYLDAEQDEIVKVSEDEYTFRVESLEVDDEKMILKGSITGPELKYEGGTIPADIEIVPKDFREGATDGGSSSMEGSKDTFAFTIEEHYKDGEVEKFLQRNQEYITLDVMVYRRKDPIDQTKSRKVEAGDENKRDYRLYWQEDDVAIKEFKEIKVPFNYIRDLKNRSEK